MAEYSNGNVHNTDCTGFQNIFARKIYNIKLFVVSLKIFAFWIFTPFFFSATFLCIEKTFSFHSKWHTVICRLCSLQFPADNKIRWEFLILTQIQICLQRIVPPNQLQWPPRSFLVQHDWILFPKIPAQNLSVK